MTTELQSRADGAIACSDGWAVRFIAPDLLEAAYDRAVVIAAVKGRASAVKRVLLDQGVASGIGNIYADEALWRARVHGERLASSLTKPRIGEVLDEDET